MQLREKKVGPYTVRELSMRETMRILAQYPEDEGGKRNAERGAAMLGGSVYNGTGEPLGLAVLDVGAGIYRLLMAAHGEVNSTAEFEQPAPAPGETSDPGNG